MRFHTPRCRLQQACSIKEKQSTEILKYKALDDRGGSVGKNNIVKGSMARLFFPGSF